MKRALLKSSAAVECFKILQDMTQSVTGMENKAEDEEREKITLYFDTPKEHNEKNVQLPNFCTYLAW